MLIVLEGPDCGGKSTLATTLAMDFGYIPWHLTWTESLNLAMEDYMWECFHNVKHLMELGHSVVVDRWWPSERVYGDVFRDGVTFPHHKLIEAINTLAPTYILCMDDEIHERHERLSDPAHPYKPAEFQKIINGYQEWYERMLANGYHVKRYQIPKWATALNYIQSELLNR